MQTLLHIDAFTNKCFYTHTHTFTPGDFYTKTPLHTDTFTQTHSHAETVTQKLLHTDAFTHRSFYTEKLLHTDAFTHKHFYTQTLLHTNTFTHRDRNCEIAILPRAIEPHFGRKGCDWTPDIAILPRTSFRAKWLRRTSWNRNFTSVFWQSNLISCERVAAD